MQSLNTLLDNPEHLAPMPKYHLDASVAAQHHAYLSHHNQLQGTILIAFAALNGMTAIVDDPDNVLAAEDHMRVYSANLAQLASTLYTGVSQGKASA